jgi:hypothetical protein
MSISGNFPEAIPDVALFCADPMGIGIEMSRKGC